MKATIKKEIAIRIKKCKKIIKKKVIGAKMKKVTTNKKNVQN